MRILYLHQYFTTPSGSGGTRSYEMARRWADAGHDIQIVTSRTDAQRASWKWERQQVGAFDVHAASVPYSNSLGFTARIRAFAQFAALAGPKAAALGGDVVLATSTPLTILIPGFYAARRLGIPLVFEVRDLWPTVPIAVGALRNPILKTLALQLERAGYRKAARIVLLSPDMVEHVIHSGGDADRIVVAPNACDVALFQDCRLGARRFLARHPELRRPRRVIYAGALGEINAVDYLADIARYAEPLAGDLDFIVAGDGRQRAAVEQHARAIGVLGRNFWMLPKMPKRDVVGLFGAAIAATSMFSDLPEMWANSANKFFDALAAGLPVIINYRGWQADLVRRERCGLVLPARDAKRAAIDLVDFLNDENRVARAGEAARSLADREFHRDVVSRQVLEALQAAVSGTSGNTGASAT